MRTSRTPRLAAGVAAGEALRAGWASGRAVAVGAALPSLDPQPSASAASAPSPNPMALLTPLRMADALRRYAVLTDSGTSISRLRILPVGPFGSSSTNQMRRGYL